MWFTGSIQISPNEIFSLWQIAQVSCVIVEVCICNLPNCGRELCS